MENYLKLNKEIISTLKEMFVEIGVRVRNINYQGIVHAFFLEFKTEFEIETKWEEISNAIAVYFQTKLESEFEIWNLYLFYISKSKMEKELKYKIENNTISSRKIVIDSFIGRASEKALDNIVSEHITNMDLNSFLKKNKSNEEIDFKRNPVFEEVLKTTLISKKKKNSDQEIQSILSKIERKLST